MRLKLAAILAVSAGCLALAAPLLTQPVPSGTVPQDRFEAFSPFWFPGAGTELSMVVNNPLGKDVAFTFELRDAEGNSLHSEDRVVEANGNLGVPLRELLPADMRAGYCVIRYSLEFQGELPAQSGLDRSGLGNLRQPALRRRRVEHPRRHARPRLAAHGAFRRILHVVEPE